MPKCIFINTFLFYTLFFDGSSINATNLVVCKMVSVVDLECCAPHRTTQGWGVSLFGYSYFAVKEVYDKFEFPKCYSIAIYCYVQ